MICFAFNTIKILNAIQIIRKKRTITFEMLLYFSSYFLKSYRCHKLKEQNTLSLFESSPINASQTPIKFIKNIILSF